MTKELQVPDFFAIAKELKRDLQSDAEKQGMDFIHSNFQKQGFTDSAFVPWNERRNYISYNLLRVTGTLFRSIDIASSTTKRIVFEADAPYAAIHNEGGVLKVRITAKSRKYFWYMYRATGKSYWKYMAISKKKYMNIKIPQRKFMGHSNYFARMWQNHVAAEVEKRFKQHIPK